jgi:hypothetical protein
LVANWQVNNFRRLHFAKFDLNRPSPDLGTISSPNGLRVVCVALAPQGDRLAWLVERQANEMRTGQLERTLARLGLRQAAQSGDEELWITDLRGRSRRFIGSRPVPRSEQAMMTWPNTCAWSPNGKRIAFTARNELWTIDVQ